MLRKIQKQRKLKSEPHDRVSHILQYFSSISEITVNNSVYQIVENIGRGGFASIYRVVILKK